MVREVRVYTADRVVVREDRVYTDDRVNYTFKNNLFYFLPVSAITTWNRHFKQVNFKLHVIFDVT